MPTLSNNKVANLTVQNFRHTWSQQLQENVENGIFKNFEDKEFTKIRNKYAIYKKEKSSPLFSSAFNELKEQRRTSANSIISIIYSDNFKNNILMKIKEYDSIDTYFSKLFKALLNGEIKILSKLLFNNEYSQHGDEKSFMKAISLVFGLRGNISCFRKALSLFFYDQKKMIACSKDMENILIHLSLIRHSLKNPKNNNDITPENLIPANLKIALDSLNKMKEDVLSYKSSGFNTLKENKIQKINKTASIIRERAIAELKLTILQNFYTKTSSKNSKFKRYQKDYLLKEIHFYNDKDNYNEETKALLWENNKNDFEKFIKDIEYIHNNISKKVKEYLKKGKIDIIYNHLNNEIFNVGLECNIFTILREDLLNIITDNIKNQISFDTCINSNAYKEILNGLFSFYSLYSKLESTVLSSTKTRYLKCIPLFGEYAYYTCELLGIQTLEDLVQKEKIESATKLSKKIKEEQDEKILSTPKGKTIDQSTEDLDCEYKTIHSENYKLKTNTNGECIIDISTKKSPHETNRILTYNLSSKKFENED